MLRQNYLNKYKEKSLFSIDRFLKEDEEYILNESRPIKESSIRNLDDKKMDKFIENILTDKDLTSILYSANAKKEIKSYLKTKKNFELLRKNKKNKTEKGKREISSIFKKRFIKEAYNQMRSEIDNYKTSQLNKQNSLKFNNYKKFLEIKKIYDTEKDKKEKEIENNRIIGIKRAYEKIKGKFEEKKQKMRKNLLLTEAKLNIADNKNLISLPKLHLNIQNVYSRLYKNAVIIPPSNSRGKNQLGQLKRQLTQDNENKINTCFYKYSGGPSSLSQKKESFEEKKNEISKDNKQINFYDLEDKKTGNSYLHSAIIDNYPELVGYIIEKNADVNKQNNDGDTALHLALKSRNFEIIKLIMSKKPALDIKNKEGIIPLDLFTPQMKVYFNIERLSFEDKKK